MYWNYVSCLLTVISTLLVGKRLWHGWMLAGLNSVIICFIGFQTKQWGFIPANLFCLAMYAHNIRKWRVLENNAAEAEAPSVKAPVAVGTGPKAFDGYLPTPVPRESISLPNVPAYVHIYTDPSLYYAKDGVTPVC
jgi:hypothetical protein